MERLARTLREALRAAEDLQSVCDTTVDVLVEAGCALPSIYLRRGERLRCHASRGYWQIVDGFLPGAGVMGRVYVERRPIIIHDATQESAFIAAVPGIVGEASLPIVCRGETIGVLNIETMDALPEDAMDRLSATAHALGERIGELGGLPEETLAERTSDAVVSLSALNDPTAIAQATVSVAARLSGMESALLLRDLDIVPAVRASVGPSNLLARLDAEALHDLAELVRSGTSSYVTGDQGMEPRHEFLREAGVGSLIVLPLRADRKVTGLLLLADREARTPGSELVRLLEQLALQAANAMRTVEALQEQQRQVELLEVVNDVLAMFASLSAQGVSAGVDTALATIGAFAEVDRSYLFRMNDDGVTMDNTNEWCAAGVEPRMPELQGIPQSFYADWLTTLHAGEPVHVPSIAWQADDATKTHLDPGIRSLVAVPLLENGVLVGALGFDSLRKQRPWSDQELQLLRTIANVLVNAWQRKEAADELERLALHDTLTGLPNRTLFTSRLEAALRRCQRRPDELVAVLFCDLDEFKQVNDRLGHEAGDALLQSIADRMRPLLRAGDTLARMGGDEFTLVCEGLKEVDEARVVARRLVEAVAEPLTLAGQHVELAMSVGVATTGGEPDGATLLAEADAAMYAAKRRGGNQVALAPASGARRRRGTRLTV